MPQPFGGPPLTDLLKPLPNAVSIDYSTACNLRCQYCHTGGSGYEVIDMTKQMIDDIYEFCVQAGISLVCTSANGETTMYPRWHEDLGDFLDHPKFTLQINSNFARDFSDDDLLALNKHHKLQLSIDSASPALMKEQRTADMRTILSNAVRFKHMMMKTGKKTIIDINCTVTRKNITHIGDLARLALVLQADALVVTEMMVGSDNPNMPDGVWDLTDDEACKFVASISEAVNVLHGTATELRIRPGLVRKLHPIIVALNEGRPGTAESLRAADNADLNLGPCIQPWTLTFVVANGDVRTCCGQGGSVGNMRDEKLIDIINGPAARDIRAGLLAGEPVLPCKTCWAAVAMPHESFVAQIEQLQRAHDAAHGTPVPV